jgi:hypothetical protein
MHIAKSNGPLKLHVLARHPKKVKKNDT